VAVGADATLTTLTTPAPPAPPAVTGGGGTPPAVVVKLGRLPGRLTLDRRDRFAYAFALTGSGSLPATIKLVIPRARHARAVTLLSKRFTARAGGRIRFVVTVRGAALRRLRQLRTAKVAVTIVIGGRRYRATLRLSVPRPRRRR